MSHHAVYEELQFRIQLVSVAAFGGAQQLVTLRTTDFLENVMNLQRAMFIAAMLVAGLQHVTAVAEPWSQRLGFEPGKRVIILDAREIGIMWEMNEAAIAKLEKGEVSSVGIVATGPWFNHFAAWSRKHPEYDYGVSIALTNPYSQIQWSLLTSEHGPTSLVNADGSPWQSVTQLAVTATADDVKREVDAQITAARKAGVPLSHINAYHGTVFSRPDLAAVFLGAAKKYWLPAPVVELTPELIERFSRMGFPVDKTMIELIEHYPLPKLDDLQYLAFGETFEQKKANIIEQIKNLKPGLTQLACRPAVESRGLQLLSIDWQQRVWDSQVLADEEVKQVMSDAEVIVTNWREIMMRFEQGQTMESGAAAEEGVE